MKPEHRVASRQTHLECSRTSCATEVAYSPAQDLCPACRSPLFARYDLSLGEGMTPLLRADRCGSTLGLENLFIRDEGLNPTGSFKARGLSAAVSMAKAHRYARAADGRQRRRRSGSRSLRRARAHEK